MDLSVDEFQRLADDKSQQKMRIADLERQLTEKNKERAVGLFIIKKEAKAVTQSPPAI